MKVADLSNGPEWTAYVICAMLFVMSVILISGHGSWLISGYNTSSKEKKAKYDEKKLCRVTGVGTLVITVFVTILLLFENVLPSFFVYITLGIVVLDSIVIMILGNTICRR